MCVSSIGRATWTAARIQARANLDNLPVILCALTPENVMRIENRIAGMLLDAKLAEYKIVGLSGRSNAYYAETAVANVRNAILTRLVLLRAKRSASAQVAQKLRAAA